MRRGKSRSLVFAGILVAGNCLLGVTLIAGAPSRAAVFAGSSVPVTPGYRVLRDQPGTAAGLFFVTPRKVGDSVAQQGPEIIDGHGRPVWFHNISPGHVASDLRVQSYRGQPVLTWLEMPYPSGPATGYIADSHYHIFDTVKGVSAPADAHEFKLTKRGTALLVENAWVKKDLTSLGGPNAGLVANGVIEEIDLRTGKSLWRWSSLDHVPLSDSYQPVKREYDYIHLNSISEDGDGNLLISGPQTHAVYKVERSTGRIMWILGGRRSTFQVDADAQFAVQHDAMWAGDNIVRIFDNSKSRVIWVRVDPARKTATLIKTLRHPDHLTPNIMGNAQELPNGNTVVGWGSAGRISEYSSDGGLLSDIGMPAGWDSYRSYRFEWDGQPSIPPSAVVDGGFVHALWNGATNVARWRVLAGTTQTNLEPVTEVPWNGLDTPIKAPAAIASGRYVKVEALAADGKVSGVSSMVRVST